MRGHFTRRYIFTEAKIGYYDMQSNKMIESDVIRGRWKTPEQVQRYVKKNRDTLHLPEGKQITVLGMEEKIEYRKMSHDDFYRYSEPVEMKIPEAPKKTSTRKKK